MEEKTKIFILDDEVEALQLLKKSLVAHGFEVEVAADPLGAIERIKLFKPRLILLDLRMPHLGGFEVCQMLNNDSQTSSIPILITSGLVDEADIKRAYRLGAGGYLRKPFTVDQLLFEINKVIGFAEKPDAFQAKR